MRLKQYLIKSIGQQVDIHFFINILTKYMCSGVNFMKYFIATKED